MKYTPTIGLEIHSELLTRTKMFCSCLNDETELTANKNICPVCLAHPGTLPVPNKQAIDLVIKTGLALNCEINKHSKFDRKNYFYPDLPKAYQISQYDQPLCKNGFLVLPESKQKIGITRIHLEEDTAKLAHSADGSHSLVDFNRAGVPLMELVTEPDFHSAQSVVEFAREFQLILRYVGASDADMEKGHLRLEANISVAPEGSKKLGTKVEVKNLNSFQAVFRAVEYEIKRHTELLEAGKGEEIVQETRGWNESSQQTFSQRSKEDAHDYRYFPDPDLPPMEFSDADIEKIRAHIAELPAQRRERLSREYNLSEKQAELLVQDIFLCTFLEEAVSELRAIQPHGNVEMVYNYIASDLQGMQKDSGMLIGESKIAPAHIAQIVAMIGENKISSRVAKDVLRESFDTGVSPRDLVEQKGLAQISDESVLEKVIAEVIKQHAGVVEEYKKGKISVLQFLVGQVMAQTKGTANPGVVRVLLEKELSK
jgi:aspartyl-tRNA(Asn)/glutamyl-tRNA(Gln) amidotransferase subunit B